jgi:hypothetical protein
MFNVFGGILVICFVVGLFYLQKHLCNYENKWVGLILPTIFIFLAIYVSIPNFKQAFYIEFSIGAFIASMIIFLFYLSMAMSCAVLYFRQNKFR